MKVALICLTSSQNAISDSFMDYSECLVNDGEIFFIGTQFSLSKSVLESRRFLRVDYPRNFFAALQIVSILIKIRKYINKNDIKRIFVYSTLPVNGLISYVSGPGVDVQLWLHDPKPHSGENPLSLLIRLIDVLLLKIFGKVSRIWLGARRLKQQVNETFLNNIPLTVLPLPYINRIVATPISEVPVSNRQGLIFFGRIEKYKGLPRLIRVLVKFSDEFNTKPLIRIIGKGDISSSLIEDLKRAGYQVDLQNKYVTNAHLASEIAKSSVAVFPYVDATATQAIQTAGALGCKVVATDVGALSEFVLPIGGYVVDPRSDVDLISNIVKALNDEIQPALISRAYKEAFDVSGFSRQLADGLARDLRVEVCDE